MNKSTKKHGGCDSFDVIIAILQLIHEIISQEPNLAIEMQKKLIYDGKDSWISIFLHIFTHLSFSYELNSEIAQILSLTLYCISDFAHTQSEELWKYQTTTSTINVTSSGVVHSSQSPLDHHHHHQNYVNNNLNHSISLIHCMPHLLHHYEIPSGKFCFTIPLLQYIKTMLQYLQHWKLPLETTIINSQIISFNYLEYIRLHVLVSFHSWRYYDVRERWEIGLSLMEILQLIITDVSISKNNILLHNNKENDDFDAMFDDDNDSPSSSSSSSTTGSSSMINNNNYISVKENLLHWLLHDSSFHNVILNIISNGYDTLTTLRSSCSSSEIKILEELIWRAFDVLDHVLLERDGLHYKSINGESSLEHALMSFSLPTSGQQRNFILVISSFILYKYNRKLPLVATKILRSLAQISLEHSDLSRTRPPLVAYLGNEADYVCTQIMQILKGNYIRNEELLIEILQLVGISLEYQLGLAERLLCLDKEKIPCGPVTFVLSIISTSGYPTKQPKLYSAALSLLHSLWESTPEHAVVHSLLRKNDKFWKNIMKPLEYLVKNKEEFFTLSNSSSSNHNEKKSFLFAMSGWSLRILSLEIFYYPKDAPSRFEGFIKISSFIKNHLCDLCSIYSEKLFDISIWKEFNKFTKINFIDNSLFLRGQTRYSYGPAPLYNLSLVKRKFLPLSSSSSASSNEIQFISLIESINDNMSMLDAQLGCFKAFQCFVQLITSHPDVHLSNLNSNEIEKLIIPLLSLLSNAISDDRGDLDATRTHLRLLSDLLVEQVYQNKKLSSDQLTSSIPNSSKTIQNQKFFIHTIEQKIKTIKQLTKGIEKFISTATRKQQNQQQQQQNNNFTQQNHTDFDDNIYIPQHETLSNILLSLIVLFSDVSSSFENLSSNNSSSSSSSSSSSLEFFDEFQEILLHLIPSLCMTSSCLELKKNSFLLLSVVVREFLNKQSLISYFHKFHLFSIILDSFIYASSNYHQDKSLYDIIDASIQLILSLASFPLTAEQLMIHKFLFIFCDTSQAFFHHNLNDPYINQKRNPLHVTWCDIIRILIQMSFSLHSNDSFRQILPRFIIIHQERLLNKWKMFHSNENYNSTIEEQQQQQQQQENYDNSSSNFIDNNQNSFFSRKQNLNQFQNDQNNKKSSISFTIGILEEIECVSGLYDRWIHSLTDWKLNFNPRSKEITFHLRYVLQFFVLSLLNPSELDVLSNPITEQEQKRANFDQKKKKKQKNTGSVRFRSSLSLTSSDSSLKFWKSSEKDEIESSLFQKDIELLIHRSISNCLSFLRKISPKNWQFHFDPSNVMILFSPSLDPSTPQASPCIGILLYCAVLCSKLLLDQDNFASISDPSSLANILSFNFQNSLAVLLLQISMYSVQPPESEFDVHQLQSILERLKQRFPVTEKSLKPLYDFVEFSLKIVATLEIP